jgi:hypothetical protein
MIGSVNQGFFVVFDLSSSDDLGLICGRGWWWSWAFTRFTSRSRREDSVVT